MKKIMIFNANPETNNASFEDDIYQLSAKLKSNGNEIQTINLRDKNINYCIGCFSCWVKTPGICVFKDDVPSLLEDYMNSDFIVFATPVIMGFISPLLKNVNERMFPPIMHPFIKIDKDKMQHLERYRHYPASCLLLEKSPQYNQKNIETIHNIYKMAKHRRLLFTKVMDNNMEEIAHEISNI